MTLSTTLPRPNLSKRARHWVVLRIVVEAAALIAVMVGVGIVSQQLMPLKSSSTHAGLTMARNLLQAVLLLGVYSLLVRRLERRPVIELNPRGGLVQAPAGLLIGFGMMASVYLILWAMGLAAFGPGDGLADLANGAVFAVLAGVFEELLLRGVLFRNLEQAFGTTVALIVSAAIFGLLHSFNPGATAFSDAAIALEAGLLLALTFALTRNLWLAIGLHAGWNFTEGNVFGAQVSGTAPEPSLIHSTLTGPTLLTGGGFGPEASIVAVCVGGLLSLLFAVVVARRGGWRPIGFRLSVD